MNKFSWALIRTCILLGLATSACEEDAPLKLTAAQRNQLDTLFTVQAQALNLELDSICDRYFTNNLDQVVDSILEVRKAQEAALRKKYQQ